MKPEELRDLAVKALEDLKGIDIVTMDVRTLTNITDYMVICTGTSTRHVKALAENVAVSAKENKAVFVRTEGGQETEWVLVDLGDVVIKFTEHAPEAPESPLRTSSSPRRQRENTRCGHRDRSAE